MSDLADLATELEFEHLSASLRGISAAIEPGSSGECDECGEVMPRLVGGRCGFCRDRRRPPLSFYENRSAPAPVRAVAPEPADAPIPVHAEETSMPSLKITDNSQTISVPAKDDVLHAIRQRADEKDLPLGQAVISIIADWIHWGQPFQEPAAIPAVLDPVEVALCNIPDSALAEEVARRLTTGVGTEDYDSAIRRAEEAEGKLATLKGLLG